MLLNQCYISLKIVISCPPRPGRQHFLRGTHETRRHEEPPHQFLELPVQEKPQVLVSITKGVDL